MRVCVLQNPGAGSADQVHKLRELLVDRPDWKLVELGAPGEGKTRGREAAEAGFEVVVAAGGDGTVSEVVNGLMELAAGRRPVFAIVPMGTGNDLSRTLAVPPSVEEAVAAIDAFAVRTMDLIEVEAEGGPRIYVANLATGGFAGEVDRAIEEGDHKSRFGSLGYLMGAAQVLPAMRPYRASLTWDDGQREELEVVNVIVANGRTVAGGWRVAPAANLEDGLMDVIVVMHGTAMELAGAAARMATASHLDCEMILYKQARSLRLEANPGMLFNADGELFTERPVTFRVVPRALSVVVGPGYVSAPPLD